MILKCTASFKHLKKGQLAPQNNYFDSAHFINSVKKHTGNTPTELFENKTLEILDKTYGEVLHIIRPIDFQTSIDWNWFKKKALERFNQGLKYTVFEISPNNEFFIGQLNKEKMILPELTSPNEVYFKTYPISGFPMTVKTTWDKLISGEMFNQKIDN